MKKILMALCLIAVAGSVAAQDKEDEIENRIVGKMEQSDRLVIDVFSDFWMNLPADSLMTPSSFNRGANTYLMSDIPLGKSNFSFSTGLGISCHNLYNDAFPVREMSMDTAGVMQFTGKTTFTKIPSKIGEQEIDYRVNKLTVVYADIPVEFRYRTRDKKFKVAIGWKVGLMLSNHNKYSGDEFWNTLDSENKVKQKDYRVKNIQAYRYGVHLRAGWKWLNVYGYYSLTTLFKKDKGPEMYPISVGLSFTPF